MKVLLRCLIVLNALAVLSSCATAVPEPNFNDASAQYAHLKREPPKRIIYEATGLTLAEACGDKLCWTVEGANVLRHDVDAMLTLITALQDKDLIYVDAHNELVQAFIHKEMTSLQRKAEVDYWQKTARAERATTTLWKMGSVVLSLFGIWVFGQVP